MKSIRWVATLLLLLPGACSPEGVDADAELAALREAATRYQSAASAKDAATVVSMYDPDAVMIPPNGARVEGLAAVQGYRFGFISTPGVELRFELVRAEVSASGDMGWTLSIGDITIARPGEPPGRDRVRDFHTWKKQPDGSWKVVVDIWNSEPPGDA